MSTGLNDEEAMLVATVRAFIDREVKPTVREVEHANAYPEAWIEQMKRIGMYGLAISEEYGGSPVSMPCYVLITQELARGWMSLAGAMGGHTVVAKLLSLFGTEEQKRRYLPPMATGELRATMALTEPRGGSDLQNMSTTALRDGDELVINGSKTWISNARHSGLIALLCKTDPNAVPRHQGFRWCWWTIRVRAWHCRGICPSSATRAWKPASCPSTVAGFRRRRFWAACRAGVSPR
ncbi:acyl-CoA dehydrogenase, N-terminal domain protein [Mycobacterium xenopi 4042]|uniref:Acyl-CoA dehydrogenase, N-terminal domain protein n=1 Tax=Mycobacterium xenopi 4042 TaxID=1299334 RepID=X8BLF9_MYCXE|nr:acyl-CoA dehydrogenase, N-terminal domain protein [Mycobacterium xenopi 4042]